MKDFDLTFFDESERFNLVGNQFDQLWRMYFTGEDGEEVYFQLQVRWKSSYPPQMGCGEHPFSEYLPDGQYFEERHGKKVLLFVSLDGVVYTPKEWEEKESFVPYWERLDSADFVGGLVPRWAA